jgi:hypothetical protein
MWNELRTVTRSARRVLRARPARILSPARLVGTAVLVILVTSALLPGTGSYARWNGAAVTKAGTVTAGTVAVTEQVSPPLDAVFRSGSTTRTGGVLVTNTSTVTTNYISTVTLAAGTSAPLAGAISLVVWTTASTASCTASATVPAGAYVGTWTSVAAATSAGALTGTLAPGATFAYCLRSTMNVASAAGIPSGSVVSLSFTTKVTAGATWSSTASASATQTFVDDIAPSAPTALSASAASGNRVVLSWTAANDNVGVVAYDIYRSGKTAPIGTTSSTSFTDGTAASNRTYTYSVVARDAVGLSSPAASIGFTTAKFP